MGSPFLKGSLDLQMFSFALTLKERVEDTLDQFMQELDNQVNLMLGVDLSPINLEAENQETSGEVLCTEGQWNHLLTLFLLLLEINKFQKRTI